VDHDAKKREREVRKRRRAVGQQGLTKKKKEKCKENVTVDVSRCIEPQDRINQSNTEEKSKARLGSKS